MFCLAILNLFQNQSGVFRAEADAIAESGLRGFFFVCF